VNNTAAVQVAFTARVAPHVVFSLKSAAFVPVNAILVILNVVLPVLLKVKLSAELLVVAGWLGKAKLAGERAATGAVTVKFSEFEAPPPGVGFVNTTG